MMSQPVVDNFKLSLSIQELETFCRANGIHRLLLFGSATNDRFRQESDIDLLVEFDPNARIGFMALGRMQRQLASVLGKPIDLVPIRGLKPLIRDEVLKSAKTLYHAS
ncbi:MAG: nucleotidyltransferase domain-containing protein [Caldilineaceae bacterium]|nr:nucleotidyltransferase domain-containing protein [Caldilineaceae bacterium]